jgi:hypothetical protein
MPQKEMPFETAHSTPVCIHTKTGRTRINKTCLRNYECWHCAFDQWLDETEKPPEFNNCFSLSRGPLAHAA